MGNEIHKYFKFNPSKSFEESLYFDNIIERFLFVNQIVQIQLIYFIIN